MVVLLFILQNDEIVRGGVGVYGVFESVIKFVNKCCFVVVFCEGWGLTEVIKSEKISGMRECGA